MVQTQTPENHAIESKEENDARGDTSSAIAAVFDCETSQNPMTQSNSDTSCLAEFTGTSSTSFNQLF